MDISLNMVDRVLADSLYESNSFKEFCEDLDQISLLWDDNIYLEAMTTKQQGIGKTASTVYRNTIDSTKAAGNVLKYSTDAGGGVLAASWKVVTSAAMLIAKLAKWIFLNIDKVIFKVADLITAVSNIPSDIKNKIKGNIKLYITAQDITNIYQMTVGNQDMSLLGRLQVIMGYLQELTQGEIWTTYFTGKENIKDFFKSFNDDFINEKTRNKTDMKLIKKIIKEYDYIKRVNFSQTIIDMSKPEIVELYFGINNKIKFRNFNNQVQELTYIEALYDILDRITIYKDTMHQLQDAMGNKFINSTNNESFSNMGKNAQVMVTKLFQTISKTVEIIGNLTRYTMSDIKTIEKSANQMKAAITKSNNRKVRSDGDKELMMNELKRRKDAGEDYLTLEDIEKEWAAKNPKSDKDRATEEYEDDEVAKYYKKHPLKKLKDNIKNKKAINETKKDIKAKEKLKQDKENREENIIRRMGPDAKEANRYDPTNPQNNA